MMWIRGKSEVTLTGFKYQVAGLAYSPDGRTLATINGWDRRATVVGCRPQDKLKPRLSGLTGYLNQFLAYSPDGRTVAVLQMIGQVKVWDVLTGQAKSYVCKGTDIYDAC